MTIAVLMLLSSVEILYRCVTNCVTRSCAFLLRLNFSHVVCIYDQYIYCSNVDCATEHCHCPSASCPLYCVPCTHLIQHVYCTFCFIIIFNDFRLSWIAADCWIMMEWWKEDNWFVLLWDILHKCEILGKSKNRRFFMTLPGRLEFLWNFSFVLLHCPNKCQFFVFQLIFKDNRRK
jgi:hypothetical protein